MATLAAVAAEPAPTAQLELIAEAVERIYTTIEQVPAGIGGHLNPFNLPAARLLLESATV